MAISRVIVVAAAATLLTFGTAIRQANAEATQLKAAEIRKVFQSATTYYRHHTKPRWRGTQRYWPDGRVKFWSRGVTESGRWWIVGDKLCEKFPSTSHCSLVWKIGPNLYRDNEYTIRVK